MGDIETARRDSYDPATLARLEQALKWPPGTVNRILRGGLGPGTGELIRLPDGPRTVHHPAEIARTIARDDFRLVWLLANAGLDAAALLRVELLIRRRREELERKLLPEVEALVADLGGRVTRPWDEVERDDEAPTGGR